MDITYFSIYTSQLDKSIEFYTEVLGFTLSNRVNVGEGGTLAFLTDNRGSVIELVDSGVALPKVTDSPVAVTIKVDDMQEIKELVKSQELRVTMGPVTMPNGITLLHISDPNGITINFVEMGEFTF